MLYYDADNNLEQFDVGTLNGMMDNASGPASCVAAHLMNVIVLVDRCRSSTHDCLTADPFELMGIVDADGLPGRSERQV
jgi:hypothetical protein